MNVRDFYSNIDITILTLSVAYFGTFAAFHFQLFQATDLKEIRKRSIQRIAKKNPRRSLVGQIDSMLHESRVLLLEPKEDSTLFRVVLWSLAVVTVLATFNKAMDVTVLNISVSDVVLYLYSAALAIAILMLYYEASYFNEFKRLDKKYGVTTATQTAEANAERKSVKLEIISAIYGADTHGIDVRRQLVNEIKNGRLKIRASNDLGGDPYPGVKKELAIKYSIGDENKAAIFEEGQMVVLPKE